MRRFTSKMAGLLLVAGLGTSAQAFQDEDTVRIGMLESQTGTYAPYGLANMWGTQIAFDEINAAGGITVGGKKVKIAVMPGPDGYDAGVDPAQSITLLKQVVTDDKVLMVKGISNSNAGIAVYNYLAEMEKANDPVVVMSSSVGTPGITSLSSFAFRNSFIESGALLALTKGAHARTGMKTAAIFLVTDNPYYVKMTDEVIRPALAELGVEIVAVAEAIAADTAFTPQANMMRGADPDVIYLMAPALTSLNFLKEIKRRQVTPDLMIGNVSLFTTEMVASGGDAVEGIVIASAYDPASPDIARFAETYKALHGQDINMFSVTAYEAGYLIAHAIEASGITNTPETLKEDRVKFRDALAAATITSPTGDEVKFDENRDAPKEGMFLVIKDGAFVSWTAETN